MDRSDVQLVLVEHALVEARRQADVRDVTLLEVDAAAQLAARDVLLLAHQCLEQVWSVDGDRAARACHVEMRADVAPEVRKPERDARQGGAGARRWLGRAAQQEIAGDSADGAARRWRRGGTSVRSRACQRCQRFSGRIQSTSLYGSDRCRRNSVYRVASRRGALRAATINLEWRGV